MFGIFPLLSITVLINVNVQYVGIQKIVFVVNEKFESSSFCLLRSNLVYDVC